MRTINNSFQYIVTGLCGNSLGMMNIDTSEVFICFCIIIYTILVFAKNENEVKINLITKLVLLFTFVITTLLIYTSVYVQWTLVNNPVVIGVQPRYFLPIILLTPIFLDNKKLSINLNGFNRYLSLFIGTLNLQAILTLFFTYLG